MDSKDRLRQLFKEEAQSGYEELDGLIVDLESDLDNLDIINNIFRIIHTLKGNAYACEMTDIAQLAHKIEDIFGEVREEKISLNSQIISALFSGIDALGALITVIDGTEKPDITAIVDVLKEIMETGAAKEATPESTTKKTKMAGEAKKEADAKISFSNTIPVSLTKLDALLNLVGELIIERDSLCEDFPELKNRLKTLNRVAGDLQYSVMDVRLDQVGGLFNKFKRVVRDIANIEEKEVELILKGTEIEIDRKILQIISDSLIHLVRNSVGHGIELPADRKKVGKPEMGSITLLAKNENENVIIEIIDDGKGIDPDLIGRIAVKKGLINERALKSLSKKDKMMFIFEPGFSSTDQVSSVSGRGVGMDAVKKAIDSIGGALDVESEIGKGSKMILKLPSTMVVKKTLIFQVRNQPFALPLSYSQAIISISKSDITKFGRGLSITYLGQNVHLIFLEDILKRHDEKDQNLFYNTYDAAEDDGELNIIIVEYESKLFGIAVDELNEQKEIVERPLKKPIADVQFLSGYTILGDGSICQVINVTGLLGYVNKLLIYGAAG